MREYHSEAIAGIKYSDRSSNRHTKRCHMASLLRELSSQLSSSCHDVSYQHKACYLVFTIISTHLVRFGSRCTPGTLNQYLSGHSVSSLLECLFSRKASPGDPYWSHPDVQKLTETNVVLTSPMIEWLLNACRISYYYVCFSSGGISSVPLIVSCFKCLKSPLSPIHVNK